MRSEVILSASPNMVAMSMANPDALYVSTQSGWVARNGCSVRANPQIIHLVLALAGRPDTIVSHDDLIDLIYGDHHNGGPDDAKAAIHILIHRARSVFSAIGYLCQAHYGARVSVRPVLFAKEAA